MKKPNKLITYTVKFMDKSTLLLILISIIAAKCQHDNDFVEEREKMVRQQIIARGITDTATIRAMRDVPRHEFVPTAFVKNAYNDGPLPIGYNQTISQPYIVALMTELIKPHKGQKVLEIGTGSGYQAAILAEIVDSVYTIEIVPELAESATKRLQRLGYRNINVRCGDGYLGWKEVAPFDAIVVTAAAEEIPKPLIEQLKDGGVMVIPVGSEISVQELKLITKKGEDFEVEDIIPVRFVPLVRKK